MDTELSTDPTSLGSGNRPDSGKFMYYRMTNGYITVGPAWPIERNRRENKGDKPLPEYGTFNETKAWNFRLEPYRRILALGGAKEFPKEQIVELGWSHKAPYKDITFPQMEEVPVATSTCAFCRKSFYALDSVIADSHLRKHESITHKEVSSQQQLARALAAATREQSGSGSGSESLAVLSKLLSDLMERQQDQDKRMAELTAQLESTATK